MVGRKAGYGRRVGAAIGLGPVSPAAPVMLGQHTEGSELPEAFALLGAIAFEQRIVGETGPEAFEGLHLETYDGITVDTALAVEGSTSLGKALEIRASLGGARHVLNVQVQRVAVE